MVKSNNLKPLCAPPIPPDPQKTAQIVRLGPIGKCLDQALRQILIEDNAANKRKLRSMKDYQRSPLHDDTDDESDCSRLDMKYEYSSPDGNDVYPSEKGKNHGGKQKKQKKNETNKTIRFNRHIIKSILESFDNANTDYSWYDPQPASNKSWYCRSEDENEKDPLQNLAPAAIMKGNIKHFNRFQGKWRIIVSNAQFLPRHNLASDRSIRGKRKFHSITNQCDDHLLHTTLWELSLKRSRSNQKIPFDGDAQILVFDDNE